MAPGVCRCPSGCVSVQPFQTPRAESQLGLRFRIGSPPQAGSVIDGVRPGGLHGSFLSHTRWFGGASHSGEGRQPDALFTGIIINDVVDTRRALERSHRSGCGIRNVYPAPDTLSSTDDRHQPSTNLFADIAFATEPRSRSVEKSVSQSDTLPPASRKNACFQLSVSVRTSGHCRRGIEGESVVLIGETGSRSVPKGR